MNETTPDAATQGKTVFVSYSREDKPFLEELLKYLKTPTNSTRVESWSDEMIRAGTNWRHEIELAIANAEAAVLLISQDFLASEFISNVELESILEAHRRRGLRLFLVPIGPSRWKDTELQKFQWTYEPERPLRYLNAAEREHAWVLISETIERGLSTDPPPPESLPPVSLANLQRRADDRTGLKAILPPQYEIVGQAGEGEFSVVFQAHDRLLDRDVAIKVVKDAELRIDSVPYDRYVRTAAQLKHRNIVGIYDAQLQRLPHYVITEFVDGPTLERIVSRAGRLPVETVVRYFLQVGSALAHAHAKHFIHNRIRPSNVFVDEEDNAVISGFRTATITSQRTPQNRKQSPSGLVYMSPEERAGGTPTEPADQYLLGVLVYEMIAGHPPVKLETWQDVLDKHEELDAPPPLHMVDTACPRELSAIVMRMLEKDPSRRWPSVEAVVAEVLALPAALRYGAEFPEIRRLGAGAADTLAARESFRRCHAHQQFYSFLYDQLFDLCPEVRPLFANTNFRRQHDLLRHAILLLLVFPEQRGPEPTILTQVAERHSSRHLGVKPEHYAAFVEALVASVEAFDPEFYPGLGDAWRRAVAEGIGYMTAAR
ncbi:MAG TPA: protein kinase [Polyangiaceae bacterium]|jgi:hemoglobin-like flavoprotein